ncbi:MAG: hypothetical protein M1819_007179 [Sarea resinae]|nr:MAG: hypothetical protein M1819_007179 [Sarea resinae]
MPPPIPPPTRLLITSLGNPPPLYADTLHSAGHTTLSALRVLLSYPEFTPAQSLGLATSRAGGGWASRSIGEIGVGWGGGYKGYGSGGTGADDWTLYMSGSLMNTSGPAVKGVWERWRRAGERMALQAQTQAQRESGAGTGGARIRERLVVLHDELEAPLGKVSVRRGGVGARGHNGMRSILSAFNFPPPSSSQNNPQIKKPSPKSSSSSKTPDLTRISIGISRPPTRDSDAVARYVLRKMTGEEKAAIEGAAVEVLGVLRRLCDEE